MCGILGFASAEATGPETDRVRRGLGHLRHRGPDAERTVELTAAGARCVLGHTRLSIIDVSERAGQPLANEDETIHVAYNGEIYNYRELRDELRRSGHRFSSSGDTEVLVHLYEAVDGNVRLLLDRLRGMFAFALFDSQRGRLVLARDRWGIKPLYYSTLPGTGVAFASESRALVRAGFAGAELDGAAFGAWLRRGVVPGSATLFRQVRSLPPGHLFEWNPGGWDIVRWWQPDSRPDAALADPADATRLLRTALDDAVARHLVADRPVALFLSGGLDSSAVAYSAARQGLRLRAITLTCNEDRDESVARAARSAAQTIGAEWTEVRVDGRQVAARLEVALRALDQPSWDGLNTWLVSAAAAEHGCVVCLSGIGGDELFGGYPVFDLVPCLRRSARLLSIIPPPVRRSLSAAVSRRHPGGALARALDTCPSRSAAWEAVRGLFAASELRAWSNVEPSSGPADDANGYPDRTAVSLLELRNYMADQLLRDTDSVSMANSLEVRLPLIDDALSRVALALPESVRFAAGKATLASAAGVPPTAKRPFALPLDAWLRGPMREHAREALLSDRLPFAKLLSRPGRERIWNAFLERRAHPSRVWAITVLRLWPAANGVDWRSP